MLTESFSLRHRPAEDLIPLIKPFIHPEGAISGSGFKLFIKTTGSNMEQLKEIITELDVKLKTLRISISTDSKVLEKQQQLSVSTQPGIQSNASSPGVQKIIIEKGAKHSITTRVSSTETRTTQPTAQYIQLLEGQWAMIKTGNAIPYTERQTNPDGTVTETIHYQQRSTGFKVRAHTNGDLVYLTLRPEIEQASEEGGGKTVYQNIDTSITTHLNKWVELGGTNRRSEQSAQGLLHRTQRQEEIERGMFIKVEIVN
ncbi:MAG: hypothetical protein OEY89_02285 [Gammaproteobacteria bacterium]|nr:hypothetical protein [Gammaproteobacteria bacterium]